MEKTLEDLKEIIKGLRCEECNGSGATSTPSSHGPCSNCDGTGFYLDAPYNDYFDN